MDRQAEITSQSETDPPQNHHPVGTVLRVGTGPTALMIVTHVHVTSEGTHVRYYGQHCMGGLYCATPDIVGLASEDDLAVWNNSAHWRSTHIAEEDELVETSFE